MNRTWLNVNIWDQGTFSGRIVGIYLCSVVLFNNVYTFGRLCSTNSHRFSRMVPFSCMVNFFFPLCFNQCLIAPQASQSPPVQMPAHPLPVAPAQVWPWGMCELRWLHTFVMKQLLRQLVGWHARVQSLSQLLLQHISKSFCCCYQKLCCSFRS